MHRVYFLWEELKSTFWFVPILIIVLSAGLAVGLVYLDTVTNFQPTGIVYYIFTGSAASARSILSTISGAMIGVAGTVFSITLVALTLASSQFGPRLLRNFMHERINQVVLGTYISTYVYCLIVLNSVKEYEDVSFIPSLSVFFAIIAAVANIILLIVFIHHIAVSIQAENVVSDIYESLSENISVLFPEEMGEASGDQDIPDIELCKEQFTYEKPIISLKSGYLQYIDNEMIMDLAVEKDQLIILKYRPGDYLVQGMTIGRVYANEKYKEEDLDELNKAFIIGRVRTPQQDAEFSIHQMVEIAVRALSPGINDPRTAISCIDNLTSTMCYLTKVKFPSRYRYDKKDQLRVITEALTYQGMLAASFNEIRQSAEGSPPVLIRLMEALATVNKFAKNAIQKAAIQNHAKMVLSAAKRSFKEKNDLEDMKERSRWLVG